MYLRFAFPATDEEGESRELGGRMRGELAEVGMELVIHKGGLCERSAVCASAACGVEDIQSAQAVSSTLRRVGLQPVLSTDSVIGVYDATDRMMPQARHYAVEHLRLGVRRGRPA